MCVGQKTIVLHAVITAVRVAMANDKQRCTNSPVDTVQPTIRQHAKELLGSKRHMSVCSGLVAKKNSMLCAVCVVHLPFGSLLLFSYDLYFAWFCSIIVFI